MTVSLYMDHNVVRAIVEGCRSEGLDVLTAYEDDWHERSDAEILERAGSLSRVVFTQDTHIIVLAAFAGIRNTVIRDRFQNSVIVPCEPVDLPG